MPVKTPVKKTTKGLKSPNARQTKGLQISGLKPVKKTVKKTAKKVTWDDIEVGFERLQKLHEETEKTLKKSQDEAWAAIRETQQAVKETHKNIFGLDKAKEEAWAAIRETQQAVKETHKNIFGLDKAKEEAWAAIRETQQAVKETHKNIFGLDKAKEEAWAAIRETQQAVKETQKNIGGLNNTLGSMVERIMTPALPQKFKPFGFTFDKISTIKWATNGNVFAEIDGLLENGTQAMAVEVKTTLEIEDINEHLKRMERIRKYADEHGDKREFLCAMSAMIIKPKPKEYALKQGLFVIEPSGEDVKVIKPEAEPRIW